MPATGARVQSPDGALRGIVVSAPAPGMRRIRWDGERQTVDVFAGEIEAERT
ncbi:hypothetical protein SEA_PAITO_60 [Mycobacterium phage Paito]|uniref:Uncharacterized protein n=1 Tax=Mycobacterium phage Paito TaxID=2315544 RepID=A0A386KHM0_9CAUD|nr:hypothetical protein KDW68_gp60 [Mycobacterium phage Paito]AYD84644.1 hypothetical protein SEA_PAITO_60 [Mycobacterium phage Paito]